MTKIFVKIKIKLMKKINNHEWCPLALTRSNPPRSESAQASCATQAICVISRFFRIHRQFLIVFVLNFLCMITRIIYIQVAYFDQFNQCVDVLYSCTMTQFYCCRTTVQLYSIAVLLYCKIVRTVHTSFFIRATHFVHKMFVQYCNSIATTILF